MSLFGQHSNPSAGYSGALFKALGLSEEQLRRRFGFFLDALTYGTPPHAESRLA